MPIDLQNKVVLITGASSGFVEDAAPLFAQEGCKVVLAARRLERLQTLAAAIQNEGGEALAVPVDVNESAEIEVMVQTALDLYHHIDILFNNAGYGSMDWFEKLDPERNIETIIKVNLIGTMLFTRAVLPHLLKRGKGHIINMSSVAGRDLSAAYHNLFRGQVRRARVHRCASPRSRAVGNQGQRHLSRSRNDRVRQKTSTHKIARNRQAYQVSKKARRHHD